MSHAQPVDDLKERLHQLNAESFKTDNDRQELLTAARSLCIRLEKPMETLLRIAWVEPAYTACLKIGIDVGLFAALDKSDPGRALSAKELAERTSTDENLLQRVLRLLLCMGTVNQAQDDKFYATALSDALTTRPCSATVDYRYSMSTPLFQHLPAYLKEQKYRNPSNPLVTAWNRAANTDLSFFDWLGQDTVALEVFTSHMSGYASQRGTWHDVYPIQERLLDDIEDLDHVEDLIIVDVGGGAGHDLQRFASSFVPTAQKPCLVLQDLEEVIDQAIKDRSLPPSITAVRLDFTKQAPVSGARGYYMHSVLHDWPDAAARDILERMHPSLSQRSRDGRMPKLLLNENVLLKHGVQPRPAALDLIMMAGFTSSERSEEQWRLLLESAGYQVTGVFSKPGIDEAVIEAEVVQP